MTALVSDPDTREAITARRETDARTALTRGLADYLRDLSITWEAGREVTLLRVLEAWAQPEELSKFPSAAIY